MGTYGENLNVGSVGCNHIAAVRAEESRGRIGADLPLPQKMIQVAAVDIENRISISVTAF